MKRCSAEQQNSKSLPISLKLEFDLGVCVWARVDVCCERECVEAERGQDESLQTLQSSIQLCFLRAQI